MKGVQPVTFHSHLKSAPLLNAGYARISSASLYSFCVNLLGFRNL
jgi:hypothetical protein